jgi:hypothetical protein
LWLLRVLFSWYFDRKLTKLLDELQSLFEAWRSGTLPPIPEPRVRNTPPAPAVSHAPRARQRHNDARRTPVARILTRLVRPKRKTAWQTSTPRFRAKSPVLVFPNFKNPIFEGWKRTPISLRYRNE